MRWCFLECCHAVCWAMYVISGLECQKSSGEISNCYDHPSRLAAIRATPVIVGLEEKGVKMSFRRFERLRRLTFEVV